MNEPWSPTPPPMPLRLARRLPWILLCANGSIMLLAAFWMGYDPWDSAQRIVLLSVSYLTGWGVLVSFFKPVQGDEGYWMVQGMSFPLLNPHLSHARLVLASLTTAVILAIYQGTLGRRMAEKTRRYLGPMKRPKTPEELARWGRDHPGLDHERSV